MKTTRGSNSPDPSARPRRRLGTCGELALVVLPFLALVVGCIYRESVVADRVIRRVPLGTSSEEVVNILGSPDLRLSPDEARQEARSGLPLDHNVSAALWLYDGHRWGSWHPFSCLCVYLDGEGKVEHASVTSST